MIARVGSLRTVTATRYVTPLREGGSLPALLEADDDGLYVTKFRAAGQGLKALVAELIVGLLGQAADLPVPELVLVELDAAIGQAEPDPEINELVTRSAGLNIGLDFLPGALDYNPARSAAVDPAFAAEVVWLDAWTTNVDRTPRNPNLLVWHKRTWLIDHGAAIYRHHAERDLAARATEPFPLIAEHVLLPATSAAALRDADVRLSACFSGSVLDQALGVVPNEWLGENPGAARAQYLAYLSRRLEAHEAFTEEAIVARGA
jgi:hypothetical protein